MIFSRKYIVPGPGPIKMHIVGIKWEDSVKKAAPSLVNKGWGNGYVRLPVGHKYFGIHYNDIPYEAHGGLTYSSMQKYRGIEYWVIGFDTMHAYDTIATKKRHVAHMTRELHEQALADWDFTEELLGKLDTMAQNL